MTGFLILVVLPVTLAAIAYVISLYENWQEDVARRQADIAGRAEQQHEAMMNGNTGLGVYGDYPPAL